MKRASSMKTRQANKMLTQAARAELAGPDLAQVAQAELAGPGWSTTGQVVP